MKSFAVVSILGALTVGARADVTSFFDFPGDTDGWTTATVRLSDLGVTSTGTATWNSGQLQATEIPGDLFVLVAPTKFLGNKSSYYGGSLSFRLSDATRDGIDYPNLLLRGGGLAMFYSTAAPSAAGTDYSVALRPEGWRLTTGAVPTTTQFAQALSNIQNLGINGDWTSGGQDVVTLDNVVMSPVPEPATMVALGLGLAGFVRRRSRR